MTTYRISEIPLPLGAPEGLLRRLAAGLQGEDLEDMKQILTQFAS